jgi:hypothetical protein
VERLRALGEVFTYVWQTRRFVVLPLLVVLALLSLVFIVSEISSIAPFLYPLY